MAALQSINPATGEPLEEFSIFPPEKIVAINDEAGKSFALWKKTKPTERSDMLLKAARILEDEKERLARQMALEMGKPIREGIAEAEKCALLCKFYAENAGRFLAPEDRSDWSPSEFGRSLVRFDPIGPILAIMPWNFPFWQVFRCAAPALAAGNTVLLKHASNVSRCALTIEEIFHRAGLPAGAFRTLILPSSRIEEILPFVAGIALTGSEETGRRVAALGGRHLKKTVMELGGSDPFIVLADADLADAARVAARARCINSGQSCIAAKRFIIETRAYQDFLDLFRENMKALAQGDPLAKETEIGPLARSDLRNELHELVLDARSKGARVILGADVPAGRGCYYPPTILDQITPDMQLNSEEAFGPVASVFAAKDAADAVRIANESRFGLGAAIFTADIDHALSLAEDIETGSVFINSAVRSDPSMPFGGTKNSGYGRELSIEGIREFVNVKTVRVLR